MDPANGATDPRVAAFCSREHPEVFHAIAYSSDIWKYDPFDVESIHDEAREVFQRLVHRAGSGSGASAGRILLLQGEAGCGKTHLMRAFRNWTHGHAQGYLGYMQMTSSTSHYGRYVLNNLIDSLDQPYDERLGETTALMRLSTALAESSRDVPLERLDQIRNEELDPECLAKLIYALADQIVIDDRFNGTDIDLIRALLYLQCNDPRIKVRILKYLRCEDLSAYDRKVLGGLVPRAYEDAPQRLVQCLGELIASLESVPLILCVDQLEDIYNLDDAAGRFRRAMATLCDLASRIRNLVVVISCLETFYDTLREALTKPIVDRIENDPKPIALKGTREPVEIRQLIAHRLRFLYESDDVPWRQDEATFPFPAAFVDALTGLPTRQVLIQCQDYRERSVLAGQLAPWPADPGSVPIATRLIETTSLEQAWNDFRSSFTAEVPAEEERLAEILAWAIGACSAEIESGPWLEAEAGGRFVEVECHAPDNAAGRLLVGICNKGAQGGGLAKQVAEVKDRAGEHTPVLVRSTEFPSNPKTAIAQQIGKLITDGGRRLVVTDSDWRSMMAMAEFAEARKSDPALGGWLTQSRPLSGLKSLRTLLDLDHLQPGSRPQPKPPNGDSRLESVPLKHDAPGARPHEPDKPSVTKPGPIHVGTSSDRAREPVQLEAAELTRHAAFLGSTGSGKTTVALNVIEQLLLLGIPAILVDRKGDLCGYAREDAWDRPRDDERLASRRQALRERVQVALFTPGHPQGRPLSIAVAPAGLGHLGQIERGQVARYAAAALAGMMNYSHKGSDQSRVAVLINAFELLAQLKPDAPVMLPALIEYIAEKDPGLVQAVGRLDTKLFEKLVQDLETLRLTRGEFLSAQGEPLEAEALLGLGRHAAPGKTRLSIISTKFLGATQDVQFWVSQLLIEMGRWINRSPARQLQAVLLFDEADLYLPALRQPPTKEPMENLLKRARSAGLGLLLASQSPGDFDYKCRDNIRAWFVGLVKESTALAKMKPMLSASRIDLTAKLSSQGPGEFHLLRDGSVATLLADRCSIAPEQLADDEILALARRSGQ